MADEKTKAETPVPEQDETLKADAAIDPSVKTDNPGRCRYPGRRN